VDTRPDVWNGERAKFLGAAQVDDDLEKNQRSVKAKHKEGEEPRLSEVRMRSEPVAHKAVYVLGIVRQGYPIFCPSVFAYSLNEIVGQLHLHPISETHQLRPTLTYLDILSRKNKRRRADAGTDSDSDDGPPPDPDEPVPAPSPKHRDKKHLPEAKEAQVTARKAEDKGGPQTFGSLSTVRREILSIVRAEDEEHWQDFEFCGLEVPVGLSFPLFTWLTLPAISLFRRKNLQRR